MVNTTTTKTVPSGTFEEVGVHIDAWQSTFLALVRARKRIRYFLPEMPTIPDEICRELSAQGYIEVRLEVDDYHRFLVPS